MIGYSSFNAVIRTLQENRFVYILSFDILGSVGVHLFVNRIEQTAPIWKMNTLNWTVFSWTAFNLFAFCVKCIEITFAVNEYYTNKLT